MISQTDSYEGDCMMTRKRFRRPAPRPFRKLLLEALEDRLAPAAYPLTDLGTWEVAVAGGLSPGVSDEVINDAGQVILNNSKGQAFLYGNGQLTNLGSLPGDTITKAYGINNSGQIVGFSGNLNNQHAFVYKNGQMTDLNSLVTSGLPSAYLASAAAINESGQIAGNVYTVDSKGDLVSNQAFLYSAGTVTALGSFNATSNFSVASGISASGQVIGFSDSPNDTTVQDGFLFSKGQLIDLGQSNFPVGIDDSGQVLVGLLGLYSNGHITSLGVPPGYDLFLGSAINSSGQIVGEAASSTNGVSAAFLYSNGTWTDLNSLLPAGSTVELTNAFGISDNGQNIVAEGTDGHTYLLTPGQGNLPPSPRSSPLTSPPMNCTANDVVHAIQQSGMRLTTMLYAGIQAGQEILSDASIFRYDNPDNPTYQIPILYQLLAAQNGSEASALYSDFAQWMYWAYQAAETMGLDLATGTRLDPKLACSFVTNIQEYAQQLQQNPLFGTTLGWMLMDNEALELGAAYQVEYIGGLLDSMDSGTPPDDFQLGFVQPV
jgi:probable HAF family extracellular repeat protein